MTSSTIIGTNLGCSKIDKRMPKSDFDIIKYK